MAGRHLEVDQAEHEHFKSTAWNCQKSSLLTSKPRYKDGT